MRYHKRRVLGMKIGWAILAVLLLGSYIIQQWINSYSARFTYNSPDTIPYQSVGLVLGTSKFIMWGGPNVFYDERIIAAKELYDSKKVDCLLLSGDNTTAGYNEPIEMQNSLLEQGIPAERMYLDYAGVRTLDSILRARDIFGLSGFTVISQPFHIERAIFLARKNGIEAIGFEANSVSFWTAPLVYFREIGSRAIAIYDVYFDTPAKFSGEPIRIEYDGSVRPVPSKTCSPR